MVRTEAFPLAAAFTAHSVQARGGAIDAATLESVLSSRLARAHAQWPSLRVDTDDFMRYLAERADHEPMTLASLSAMAIEELYLVFALASGDQQAVRIFLDV